MNAGISIIKLDINNEMDVMLAHRRAMQFARFSGLGLAEQTRFATAVSEICRNTLEYTEKGYIQFIIHKTNGEYFLEAAIKDEGKGINNLAEIMARNPDTYRGRGLGLVYARRLADVFDIKTTSKGTTVRIQKNIPKADHINKLIITGWLKHVASEPAISAYEELKIRNSQLVELTEVLKENTRMVEKQMEEIRQLNTQLTENNQRMKEFTYAISHDLKNPLSSLKIAAEHLTTHYQNNEMALYYGVVYRSVNRLDRTIHSLIEILDIQNQETHVSRELQFKRLIEEAQEEYAAMIEETGASIKTDFSEVSQISYVEGYLHSLFHNMISNSLKYKHPSKKPVIKISSSKIGKHVVLTFKDNGIGMDLEKIGNMLFMPFSRFSEKPDGKGIGLYLVKGMVESNGGEVSVSSEVNAGTTFTFKLIPYQ